MLKNGSNKSIIKVNIEIVIDKELDKAPQTPQHLRRVICQEHKLERPCRSCAADLKAKKSAIIE